MSMEEREKLSLKELTGGEALIIASSENHRQAEADSAPCSEEAFRTFIKRKLTYKERFTRVERKVIDNFKVLKKLRDEVSDIREEKDRFKQLETRIANLEHAIKEQEEQSRRLEHTMTSILQTLQNNTE